MQKFANNWKTELLTPLAFDGTELDVPADLSAALDLGPEDYADLTINPDGPTEIVRVTPGEGGVLIITERGLEGTEPADWAAGSVVACCVTAGMLERLQESGGAPITVALSDPSAPPSTPGEAHINADSGSYWLATAYEDDGDLFPDWVEVWSQNPPPSIPFGALEGRLNDFYEPVLNAGWQPINFIPVAVQQQYELYLQSTTFVTVTATAAIEVRLSLADTAFSGGVGFIAVGPLVVGFEIGTEPPLASLTLEPGVHPIRVEAHVLFGEEWSGPPFIEARITSGAATTRLGISTAQGPLGMLEPIPDAGPALPPAVE